jgi:hypothetical protein
MITWAYKVINNLNVFYQDNSRRTERKNRNVHGVHEDFEHRVTLKCDDKMRLSFNVMFFHTITHGHAANIQCPCRLRDIIV